MKYREKIKRLKAIVANGDLSNDARSFAEKCTSDVRAGAYAKEVLEHIQKFSALQEKMDELTKKEKISDTDIDIIEQAALSMYGCDRDDAASILVRAEGERAKALLYKLADDKWDVVRCSAYDSLGLGSFKSIEVYEFFLERLTKEKNRLARSYIIMNLTDMYKNDGIGNKERLTDIFTKSAKETEGTEKIAILEFLVLLGKTQYMEEIFKEFENENPYIRLWALIAVREIADKDNYKEISNKVKESFVNEKIPFINEQLDIFNKRIAEFSND